MYDSLDRSRYHTLRQEFERAIKSGPAIFGIDIQPPNIRVFVGGLPVPFSSQEQPDALRARTAPPFPIDLDISTPGGPGMIYSQRPAMSYDPASRTITVQTPERYENNRHLLHRDIAHMLREHHRHTVDRDPTLRSRILSTANFWDIRAHTMEQHLSGRAQIISPTSTPKLFAKLKELHEKASVIMGHTLPLPVAILRPDLRTGATMNLTDYFINLSANSFADDIAQDRVSDRITAFLAHEVGHAHLRHQIFSVTSGQYPYEARDGSLGYAAAVPPRDHKCVIRAKELEAEWLARQIAPAEYAAYTESSFPHSNMGIRLHGGQREMRMIGAIPLGSWLQIQFDQNCDVTNIVASPTTPVAKPRSGEGHIFPADFNLDRYRTGSAR